MARLLVAVFLVHFVIVGLDALSGGPSSKSLFDENCGEDPKIPPRKQIVDMYAYLIREHSNKGELGKEIAESAGEFNKAFLTGNSNKEDLIAIHLARLCTMNHMIENAISP